MDRNAYELEPLTRESSQAENNQGFHDISEISPRCHHSRESNNPSAMLFGFLDKGDTVGFLDCEYVSNYADSDNGEYTLLQYATNRGFSKVVEHLLNNRANPNKTTKTKEYPIEIAARNGFHEILALLLKKEDVIIPSRILLEIVRKQKVEVTRQDVDFKKCFKHLMQHKGKININICDGCCKTTALHLAVNCGDSDTILDLLRAGASLACKNNFGYLAVEGIDAEILEMHLNECLVVVEKPLDEECKFNTQKDVIATYNYNTLLLPQNQEKCNADIHNAEAANTETQRPETEVISCISKSSELEHLLKHPIITSFLYIKWWKLAWLYHANLALFSTFCFFLIRHILVVYNSNNQNSDIIENFTNANFIILLFLLFCLFYREYAQFTITPKTYFHSSSNVIEVILIIVTAIILFTRTLDDVLRKTYSVAAILLAALEMIILIGQTPQISTYIIMLRTVFFNFLKFFLWYSIWLIAFSLSFYVLFKDVDKNKSVNNCSDGESDNRFVDPALSIFRTIIMLTGEFDSSSISFNNYPGVSHFTFIVFVIMIPIILFNLLNALAVNDIQLILKNSELAALIKRVEHIAYIEMMILGRFSSYSCRGILHKKVPWLVPELFQVPIIVEKCLMTSGIRNKLKKTFFPFRDCSHLEINVNQRSTCSGCFASSWIGLIPCINFSVDEETIRRTKCFIKEKKQNEAKKSCRQA